MNNDYEIEFKRVERDCPHNKGARAGDKNRSIIYDFNVIINGEHRATLLKNWGRLRYDLYTPDGKSPVCEEPDIPGKPAERYAVEVNSQSQFYKIINVLLEKGRIPTLAQLERMKRDREQAEADKLAAEAEEKRLELARQAGPDLLLALQALLADWKGMISEKLAREGKVAPDFETYPLAKTAQSAIDLATKEPSEHE